VFGLKTWQMTFIGVGAPGIVLAALVLLMVEPKRRGASKEIPPLREGFVQLWALRRRLGPLYLTGIFLGVQGYALLQWLPGYMMQTFHASAGEVGGAIGTIKLTVSFVGAVGGAALTEWNFRRGHEAAHAITVLVISILTLIPALIAPLAPSLGTALFAFAVYLMFQAGYFGSLNAGLTHHAPPRLRGLNSAMFMMMLTMLGYASGAVLVGGVADLMGGGDRAIGPALALVGFVSGGLSILSGLWGVLTVRSLPDRPADAPAV
jgi:MFS family permease